MAKNKTPQKNKFSNNVPPPPVASSSPSLKPVVPKVAATMEIAKSSGISVDQELRFDETLADRFSKAIPAQEHNDLLSWLEKFANLGKVIKAKIAEVESKQRQLEDEQLDLLEKHDALKKDSETFAEEFAELNPKLEEYKAAHAKIIDRERELAVRELDARNGFANQNEISLKSLREDIKLLEQQRDSIKRDIERADRQLTDSQQKKDEELHQRELEISAQQLELSRKESRLQRKLSEIDSEQEYSKKELNKQFEIDCLRWEEKIAKSNQRAEAAFTEADEAEKRLYEYRDLIN